MPEHFALYSSTLESLPTHEMRQLAGDAEFAVHEDADGRRFTYEWANFTIICHEMPAPQVANHLQGFAGWVMRVCQSKPDDRANRILDRIRATRLVVRLSVEPLRDEAGVAEQLLATLSQGLDAILFFDSAIYDKQCLLLLGDDGTFDEEARLADQQPAKPLQLTESQKARYERALAALRARQVPTPAHALYVEDESVVRLRSAADVARRVLVLSAVTLRADGGSRERVLKVIADFDLANAVTPEEHAFLHSDSHEVETAQKLLWRFESLWLLLWALGELDELSWPGAMCDVPTLILTTMLFEIDRDFVRNARLRSKPEILDAAQTTWLMHEAIHDAAREQRPIPDNLDWSSGAKMVPVRLCPVIGVVHERRHALNWLMSSHASDWDDIS